MKKAFITICLLIITSVGFSQTQLKYSFKIEKNKKQQVINYTKNQFGDSFTKSKSEFIWRAEEEKYQYKIVIKNKKVKLFYLGNDDNFKRKLKQYYQKIKDINS